MHKSTQLNISKNCQKSKITYPKRAAQNKKYTENDIILNGV
jgi:hypothetical protein